MHHNTRERLVSNDFNRMQAFAACDRASMLRRMLDESYVADKYPGVASRATGVESPLRADVIGGLLVRPIIGSTSVTVDAGSLGCYAPDDAPSSDDDPYKVIDSPGVSQLGDLVIAPNADGSNRIDVIECAPFENVEEQDNRDVFNVSTGMFIPTMVDKVIATRLQFRVRQGAAGNGWPGTAPGWLPLAVAVIPPASSSNDSVTFYDVRPLVQDRLHAPLQVQHRVQRLQRNEVVADPYASAGQMRLRGLAETSCGAYLAGGWIRDGAVEYIDLNDAGNREYGFAVPNGAPYYVYALFPFGLPRWVKYSASSIDGMGRVPYGLRGIPCVSAKGPAGALGVPSSAIVLPSNAGFGTPSTSQCAIIAAGHASDGKLHPFVAVDGMHYLADGLFVAAHSVDDNVVVFRLQDNVSHPAHARKLRLLVICTLHGDPNASGLISRTVRIRKSDSANVLAVLGFTRRNITLNTFGAFSDSFDIEVPMPTSLPANVLVSRDVEVEYSMPSGMTLTGTSNVSVFGWQL